MRIGDYVLRPDADCWVLSRVKVYGKDAKKAGQDYETDYVYPGRFDQALRLLLDRMVRDGIDPDADLDKVVATVAHLYATIGEAARKAKP